MPWVSSSDGVDEWVDAAMPDSSNNLPAKPLTLAEKIAATRANMAASRASVTSVPLPDPAPKKPSLAEQIAVTRAKAAASCASASGAAVETPEEARERRLREKAARDAAEKAELDAELRAEHKAAQEAQAALEAETDVLLIAEAEAEHEAQDDSEAESDAPPKLTLAQQIAATRAKLAREETAAKGTIGRGHLAWAEHKAPPVGILREEDLPSPPEVPAHIQAAVAAGREDEVYTLLLNAPPSMQSAAGFKQLKKKLLEDARGVAASRK